MGLIPIEELKLAAPPDGKHTHYLFSFVSPAPPLTDTTRMVHLISYALEQSGAPVSMGLAYVAPIMADPRAIGLVDVWADMSPADRTFLVEKYPALSAAITLICGPEE